MAARKRSSSKESTDESIVNIPKEKVVEPTTWGEMMAAWPKTTLCIVSNEFCERFSYYGMRTVLTFYLLNVLKFTDNESTIFFNGFTVLCYFTPILGSIIADGFVGKFWTIFVVSILYASGQVILAFASTQDSTSSLHPWLDLIGLVTIGFGTGGIKPCVAAFGGDQFENGQERMLSMYFSMFYFSINAGSMISTFISPLFRSMSCMGQDSCYPLAFGIPAVLMILATCLFMAGSFWYKKPPPTENVFGEVWRLCTHAIGNKWRSSSPKAHWLEHYMTDHVCENDTKCMALKRALRKRKACHKQQYVEDVKQLGRVLVMFLPVPIFWALYDQQGSVWIIQGIEMDCRLWGDVLFLPDQVQVLNAVLILCFIPLFQVIIYPLASMICELTPLRKMVAGGLLAAASFLITGFVQIEVNKTLPDLPASGHSYVSFMNMLPCDIGVHPVTEDLGVAFLPSHSSMVDKKGTSQKSFHIKSGSFTWKIDVANCSAAIVAVVPPTITYNFDSKDVDFVAITEHGVVSGTVDTDKPTQGNGEFSAGLLLAMNTNYGQADNKMDNMVFCRLDAKGFSDDLPCDPQQPSNFYWWESNYNNGKDDREKKLSYSRNPTAPATDLYAQQYSFKPVRPGKWGIYKLHDRPKNAGSKTPKKQDIKVTSLNISMEIKSQGGVYFFGITSDPLKPENGVKTVYQVVEDNKVSILWQVPQIVVITAAEILFSITGYEFAYSQSAPSMKSVVQAAWLFTTAIGDSIIVAITAANPFSNMATMFFVYAGAMAAVICIFALMSIFYYDYKFYTSADEDDEDEDFDLDDEGKGKLNDGFDYNTSEPLALSKLEDYVDADVRF